MNTPDDSGFDTTLQIGAPFEDGPVACEGKAGFLIDYLQPVFQGLYFCNTVAEIPAAHLAAMRALTQETVPVTTLIISKQEGALDAHQVLIDVKGLLHQRYAATSGSYHLLRPDQHLTARWQQFDLNRILHAVQTAIGNSPGAA